MAEALWDIRTPGIYIDGDAGFHAAVAHDINLIRGANASGIGELIALLSKRCQGIGAGNTGVGPKQNYKVVISLAPNLDDTQSTPTTAGSDALKPWPGATNLKRHGLFLESAVTYIPNSDAEYTTFLGLRTSSYIVLAHELIHALHSLSGDLRKDYDDGSGADSGLFHEEARTVGLGIYKNTRISENAFRRRDGFPERTYYGAPNDCDNLTAVSKSGAPRSWTGS
jgi:hypothetical protein